MENVMLTGSIAGRTFFFHLVAALQEKYKLYADFLDQESFNVFYPNINRNIGLLDDCNITTEKDWDFGIPRTFCSYTLVPLYAVIRLCTLTNVNSELSALNKNIYEQWLPNDPRPRFERRLNTGCQIICIMHVRTPEENIVAKAVEARLIAETYCGLKCTSLLILGDAEDELSRAITSACKLILNKPKESVIGKLSISKFSDKPGYCIHGAKLPENVKPALIRGQISSPDKDQPYIILTGSVKHRGFAPTFVRALHLKCKLICDLEDSKHLKLFCPEVPLLSENEQLIAGPPGLSGVIRICSGSDKELDELRADFDKYIPLIPQDVSGVFICISVITDKSSGVMAKAVRAHLVNAKLEQLRSKEVRAPLRFTSLILQSASETYLSEAVSSACLQIMSAPPRCAITKICLTSYKDLANYKK